MNFSPIAATADNPRVAALQLYGRQLANAYIYLGSRATYSREIETWLIALLSGGTPTAAQLATIDQIAQAYLYLEDVRQEVLRCIADPTLTVADLVPPDPNATRPYTRASIWSGVPWATKDDLATVSGIDANSLAQLQAMLNAWPAPRTNFPKVSANYTIPAGDLGAVATTAGITLTLPAISTVRKDGLPYSVKNNANGIISVATNGNDQFTTGEGVQTSENINTDVDLDFLVCSSDMTWIVK